MDTTEQTVHDLAKRLGARLMMKGIKLATAESCTGGWIAKVLTDIAGSSDWFDSAIVSYSNEAKKHFLKVPGGVLLDPGQPPLGHGEVGARRELQVDEELPLGELGHELLAQAREELKAAD